MTYHDEMKTLFQYRPELQVEIPDYITNNLKFTLRPYQERALENHLINTCWNENNPPAGFEQAFNDFWPQDDVRREIYNMATGSGKTLVMAALMLEFYKQGKRNFLFFVHTTSIIKKTKINFLHQNESKYLFADKIMIDENEVFVNEVESFDEAAPNAINIKFMTIGKLHSEWTQPRENGLDFDTFNDQDVVFIADEYHHYHAATKAQVESSGTSWEEVVEDLLCRNPANVYLGFTATLDVKHKALQERLAPNIVFKYDLREFRNDKYSKEINLLRSNMGLSDRVLLSLLLSTYRSALAAENEIELKPVILFKSRTIPESNLNKESFHQLVDNLNTDIVADIRGNCDIPIIAKAFSFFDDIGWSNADIANAISTGFSRENVLCMNEEKELETNQVLVNTLENTDNPIRAVFAVDKLNEGWDVLTLFDIVRMFEGSGRGATPVAEAQLIGRGARLFPYKYSDLEPGKRKFDDGTDHDLRVLEELYYHSFEDREYVSDLKKELSATGIYDDPDTNVICTMTLKPEFLDSEFYQTGQVVYNDKRIKSRNNIVPFNQLRVSVNNHRYRFKSQHGQIDSAFGDTQTSLLEFREEQLNVGDLTKQYGREIIQRALDSNPFFNFGPTSSDDGNHISAFYPEISGIDDFLDMLFTLSIDFEGTDEIFSSPSFDRKQLLEAFEDLLASIESDIRSHLVLYEGTDWTQDDVTVAKLRDVFLESKELSIPEDDQRTDNQQDVVADAIWFVYDSNFGTSEEKAWVRKFDLVYNSEENQWRFLTKFEFVYMIRNEEWLRIVNRSNGEGFKPDYVLFCKERDTEVIHQVFLEPKGEGFRPKDSWKETLLQGLRKDDYSGTSIEVDDTEYLISGTDLYTHRVNENEIEKQLLRCLSLPDKGDVNVETLKAVCADLELPNDSDDKDELIGILNEYPHSDIVEEDSIPDWDELSPREVREILRARPELEENFEAWEEQWRL